MDAAGGLGSARLLIAGEFVSQHACVTAHLKPGQTRCGGDEVGLLQLGWTNFLHAGLSGSYLILLGVPAAAGVAAKGIAQSQAQSATAVKTVKPPGRSRDLHPHRRDLQCR